MSLLAFLIIGFAAARAVRAIVPGSQPMGRVGTNTVAVVGALFGGLASSVYDPRLSWLEVHPTGLICSLLGALAALALASLSAVAGARPSEQAAQ
jgi:uncharacterized membrane protein YeaQ/YmgE (transglycosylase-associated protein family)